MPLVLVIIAVIALAALAPKLAQTSDQRTITARCRQLQGELAATRTQGGNQARAAQIEAELRQCLGDARAAGEDIDTSAVTQEVARAQLAQIRQEWGHYRSTDYSDLSKRNDVRRGWLRIADELRASLLLAVQQATTLDGLDAVRELTIEAAQAAHERASCFDSGATGCGRLGVNEPEWHERAHDEITRSLVPLIGLHRDPASVSWYMRTRPRYERIGLPSYRPRLGDDAIQDNGGMSLARSAAFDAAASNVVLDAIEAKRRELSPKIDPADVRRAIAKDAPPILFRFYTPPT